MIRLCARRLSLYLSRLEQSPAKIRSSLSLATVHIRTNKVYPISGVVREGMTDARDKP